MRGAADWLAWLPDQATVQATLANLPLDAVASAFPASDPRRAQYEQWAEDALVTAVFCILLCAAIGTLAIRYFAPLLLTRVRSAAPHPRNALAKAAVCRGHMHCMHACRRGTCVSCECEACIKGTF